MKTAIKLTFGTMLVAAVAAPAQADFASRVAINGTLTYTEASNDGLSIGDSVVYGGAANFPQARRAEFIDSDMELDYGLGLTYRLGNNSDSRLFFSWDRFGWGRDSSVAGVHNLGIGANGNVTSGMGHAEVDYDQYRLGVMHTLHFGDKLDLTLNGFLDYTKLDRDIHEFAVDATVPAAPSVHFRHQHDEMEGWGPGFGATARVTPFDWCPQLGLFGGMNGALLWSDNEYHQTQVTSTGVAADYVLTPEDSDSLVAKFDAEFGVDYQRLFHTSWMPVMFKAALGLQYTNIVNAFKGGNQQLTIGNGVFPLAGNEPIAVTSAGRHDFGRWGPFLRFSLGGANS